MICQQCGTPNSNRDRECVSCGVIFKDLGRGRTVVEAPKAGAQGCTWSDRGEPCDHRAILLLEGRWLCREHGYGAQGWTGAGRGNAEPAATAESQSVRAYHAQMAEFVARGGVPYKQRLPQPWAK